MLSENVRVRAAEFMSRLKPTNSGGTISSVKFVAWIPLPSVMAMISTPSESSIADAVIVK